MINDIIIKLVDVFNGLYTFFVGSRIQGVLTLLSSWQDNAATMRTYLQGVYFIVGKPLCVYIVSAFAVILVLRLTMAIINIVGQYIP